MVKIKRVMVLTDDRGDVFAVLNTTSETKAKKLLKWLIDDEYDDDFWDNYERTIVDMYT